MRASASSALPAQKCVPPDRFLVPRYALRWLRFLPWGSSGTALELLGSSVRQGRGPAWHSSSAHSSADTSTKIPDARNAREAVVVELALRLAGDLGCRFDLSLSALMRGCDCGTMSRRESEQ